MGKKEEQLGMATGTAANRLKKMILFSLLQETAKDKCYQCGEWIRDIDELSIEHVIPWLDSNDPVELYFDLDNIKFSHLSCNISARRSVPESEHGTINRYIKYNCRCDKCKEAKSLYRSERYGAGAGRSA